MYTSTIETLVGLNIKNAAVELLAAEVAALTGESKTEAIRRALLERRERLRYRGVQRDAHANALEFLKREVWTRITKADRGRMPTTREQAAILGYMDDGL